MAKRDHFSVGLEVGSRWVRSVVTEMDEKGYHIIGIGKAECTGVNCGTVTHLASTTQCIDRSVDDAARMAGYPIGAVTLGIGDRHIEGSNSQGVVAIRHGQVSNEDRDRVLDAARALKAAPDRLFLQMLPQKYLVDDTEDTQLPIGISGGRLEARVHVVTASSSSLTNLNRCVEDAQLQITRRIASPLASSKAVLYDDERELGVVLVDIGEGTTGIAIWHDEALVHLAVIPIGGGHITKDVAFGLKTRKTDAERIKCLHGCATASRVDEEDVFEVPSVGGRPPSKQGRQFLAEIIESRVEEIMEQVREEIWKSGYEDYLKAGVVLTGGTADLQAIDEAAQDILGMPTRVGTPHSVGGLKDMVAEPGFAAAVGLAMYGFEAPGVWDTVDGKSGSGRDPIFHRLGSWLRHVVSIFF
jgi:cell division protein FtsA